MVQIFKNISVPYKIIFYFLKKLTLELTMKVQSENRCGVPLFLNFSDRWGCVVKNMPCTLYPRQREPVPLVHEAGWATGMVGTCVEILAPPSEFDPRTIPLRIESLYQLRHPGPLS
jgi:hypothetical protein